jgi:large repetitive protein
MPSIRRLSGSLARTASCPRGLALIAAIALTGGAPAGPRDRIVRTVALALSFVPLAAAQITDIRPSSPLPDATVGQSYSVRFRPVNPYQGLPVLWNITPECLDGTGLSFTPDNGTALTARISGRPTQRGTFFCTIVVTDAGNNVISRLYELTIVKSCNPPRITSAPPPSTFDPGVPFAYTVLATGQPPQTFSALGLPPGLSIDPSTGVISGTAEIGGTYPVTIVVAGCGRSAIQNFTLVVGTAPAAVTLASAPNPAVFGQDIAVSVQAAGGASVPTGTVLLCVVASGEFCAAPVGAPPAGTPASLIPPLQSATLDAGGSAAFTVHGLSIQNYVLQAYYGGDATHSAARSQPVDQFVIKGVILPPRSAARTGKAPATGPVVAEPVPALSPSMLSLLSLVIVLCVVGRARQRS